MLTDVEIERLLVERAEWLQGQLRPRDPEDINWNSVSQRPEVRDQFRLELADINDAWYRLAERSYGLCELCGQQIDEDRLRANPGIRTCHRRQLHDGRMPAPAAHASQTIEELLELVREASRQQLAIAKAVERDLGGTLVIQERAFAELRLESDWKLPLVLSCNYRREVWRAQPHRPTPPPQRVFLNSDLARMLADWVLERRPRGGQFRVDTDRVTTAFGEPLFGLEVQA